MSDQTPKKSTTLSDRLSTFLGNHRTPIIAVAAILVVIVVGVVGVFQFLDNQNRKSLEQAEAVQDAYDSWKTAFSAVPEDTEAERYQELLSAAESAETDLREAIETAKTRSSRSYADLRASYVSAQLEWELGNYEDAAVAYDDVAARFPDSHFWGPALVGSAASYEKIGDLVSAGEAWKTLVENETVPTVERPRALFNLGRLAEAQGDFDSALEYYNRLVDEHTDGNWTNLGRNRILWLNIGRTDSEG